jgi:hypothetical protein
MHKEFSYHDDVEVTWENKAKWIRKKRMDNPEKSTEYRIFAWAM